MSGDRYIIRDQQASHFITITIVDWIDLFTRIEYKQVITSSLNYCIENKGLQVFAWCLMTNHLHMIVRANEYVPLATIVRDFKKFTARRILRLIERNCESRRTWILGQLEFRGRGLSRIEKYKFWQDGYHAIQISDSNMMKQKIEYIHNNPVRRGIVGCQHHYLYSSAIDYSGLIGLVKVEVVY